MSLPPELTHIIAETRLFTDAQRYVILKVALSQGPGAVLAAEQLAAPFWAYLCDKDEATLVVSKAAGEQIQPLVSVLDMSPPYRLITFDAPLDFGVVGYLAALAAVLADAGVSLFALSAFSRDHILVGEADFDRAWQALQAFIQVCRAQEVILYDGVESV